jgi:DNA-binding IclR family transcriptional regulator
VTTMPRVKSAQRVMEIFEYFAERKSPATLMEVARDLGYPASSTSALLKSLVDLGYLDHDRTDRTFLPTLKTALLGIWVNDLLIGHSTILRLMYELRDRTNDTAILGTQSGLQVQLIHVVKAQDRASSTPISSGCLRPLLRSAMGYVLLSLKSEREVTVLARRLNAEEKDPHNRVPLDKLLRNIEFYRRHEYAYTEGAATPGGGMIATLLAAPRHQLPLALGIGAPLDRIRAMKERHVACLREIVKLHRQYMEREWDGDLRRDESSRQSSKQLNLVGTR